MEIKEKTITPGFSKETKDDFLLKFLGIIVAIAWPVYTVLPDERFGGMLMLNGLLYAILLLVSIVLLPRQNLIQLLATALIFSVLIFLPAVFQILHLYTPGGGKKSINIVVTHFTFILAGICAGRNFLLFSKFFFKTLLVIILLNLAVELYPDFTIDDRSSIGFFGGQGFARVVALTAIGFVLIAEPRNLSYLKLGAVMIVTAALGICLFVGARSTALGLTIAMLFYYLHRKYRLATFSLVSIITVVLLIWFVSTFYLEMLRPIIITYDQDSGIRRSLLTLDIFFINDVGSAEIYSVMERFDLWADSIRLIAKYPFGTGIGGYEKYSINGIERSPHNIILEVLVEMGIVIGVIYLGFLSVMVYCSFRSILPFMILLITFHQFSGDLVGMRQLIFFVGVTLQHLISRSPLIKGDPH